MMINNIASRATLNNGVKMPWFGLGVFQIDDGAKIEQAVSHALQLGYRSIDTAAVYNNETSTGKAIRDSTIPREEIFLTTKVWNNDQRAERTLAAFDESLERLGLEYVDLYLVHWPVAGCFTKTWQAMEKIYESGRARAIGVSNFMQEHLEELLPHCNILPSVNQIEFHPLLVQPTLLEFCKNKSIHVEAWSPLMQGHLNGIPKLDALAKKYRKTPAQIILRWDLQKPVLTIPKSATLERIAENANIFDFELSPDDMKTIDSLDKGKRFGPDPRTFNF